MRYVCYNKTRDKSCCDGQVTYRARPVDLIIEQLIEEFFFRLKGLSYSEIAEAQFRNKQKECEANIRKAKALHEKRVAELTDLKAEVVNTIRGTGKWSADLLNEIITKTESDIRDASALVSQYMDDLADTQRLLADVKTQYNRLINWADLFEESDIDEKKMIVSNIIDKVYIGKGSALDIHFNVTIEEFFGEAELDGLMREIMA